MSILRQSTQVVVRVGPFVDVGDAVTPETGITLGAADQAEALKAAGAATVDISGNTWAAITGADGWYDLTLSTTDTNTVGDLTIVVQDASVCLPVFARFQVLEEGAFDQIYASGIDGVFDANVKEISDDAAAADSFETMLDGGGGGTLTLAQLRINASSANGGIDIDNSGGPAIDARSSSGDAVTIQSTGGNGDAVSLAGNGSGHGLLSTGGATGHGISALGGATSGDGIHAEAATLGDGIDAVGKGSGGVGVKGTGGTNAAGVSAIGAGSGAGLSATGGATGHGVSIAGGATSGRGVDVTGGPNSAASRLQGGSSSSALEIFVASGSGFGIDIDASQGASGIVINGGASGAGQGSCFDCIGGPTAGGPAVRFESDSDDQPGWAIVGKATAPAIRATGGNSGHGIEAIGGSISGDGIRAEADTAGKGINAIGAGAHAGIEAVGGATGHGISALGGATSGDGIHAEADTLGDGIEAVGAGGGFDIHADIQGSLSGSVGSVTGNVGGNVVGNVNGSVGSVAAGGITAASIATDAIDADAIAASAVTEIQSGLATAVAVAAIQADTDDIQTRLPASLNGGRMRSHVEAMDAGTITAAVVATDAIDADALADNAITAATFAAGAINAAAIATDAIDADAIAADAIAEINATVDAALADIRLDEIIQNAASPATPTADSFWDRITSKDAGQTYDRSTDSLEAQADSGGGGLTQQQVRDAMKLAPTAGAPAAGSVDEHLDDILADTAAMQPLVDVAVSTRATPAQVNTEVDTALADIRLDELIQNAASPADPTADSFIDLMTSKSGAQTFDRTTDSLEALADSGGGGPTVQQIVDGVLDELIAGHLGAGTVGEAINDAASGGSINQQDVRDAMLLAPSGVAADGSIDDLLAEIQGSGFNESTDSLEEIRDAIDANCGGGGSGVEHINTEGM